MSKRRATIARRLVEAQHTAAMLTTFNEVDMSAVQALRARRKEAFQKAHGVNLGLSSFFVKAAVGALKRFPRINAEVQGDEMVLKRYYDVGIAVGASTGLVVPVLRDADRMTFWQIEASIKDFAQARGRGHAVARGDQGRHLHDHQWRRLRLAAQHAHPEPAAGRHPRPAQDRGAARRRRRPGRRPADDVRRPQLRPPHRRWPRGRAVPRRDQGVHRGSRTPAGGRMTCIGA